VPDHLIQEIMRGNCVAFVGAGFSMGCGLPGWSALLQNCVDEAVKESPDKVPPEIARMLKERIKCNNSESFDFVAQALEDRLGKKRLSELLAAQLEMPTDLSENMTRRMHALYSIPFRAVLTTNFDLLLLGNAPLQSQGREHTHADYLKILRPPVNQADQQKHQLFSTLAKHLNSHRDEGDAQIHEEDMLSPSSPRLRSGCTLSHTSSSNSGLHRTISAQVELQREPSLQHDDPFSLRDDPLWPIIKLHGCVEKPESMVWTRNDYRCLTNKIPEYLTFLKSMLATCTVLYMGFSFSDGYLNDLRGEVLSMFGGGDGVTRREITAEKPLGYAILHDKETIDRQFFLEHEGVKILTWPTKVPGWEQNGKDYSGLDRYLQAIHHRSSHVYLLGKAVSGRRILIQTWEPAQGDIVLEGTFDKLATLLSVAEGKYRHSAMWESKDQPEQLARIKKHLEETVMTITTSAHTSVDDYMKNKEYDVAITTFGEDAPGGQNHKFVELLEGMRKLPVENRCPVIVYSHPEYKEAERRKLAYKHGVMSFVTNIEDLAAELLRILSKDPVR